MEKIIPPDWAGKQSTWRAGKNKGELFRHATDLGPIVYRDRDKSVLVLKTKTVLRNSEEYVRARDGAQKANSIAATKKRVNEFVAAGLIKRPVHMDRLVTFDSTWGHDLCIEGTGISVSHHHMSGANICVQSDTLVRELKKLIPGEKFLSSIPSYLHSTEPVDLDSIQSFLDLEGLEIRFHVYERRGGAVIKNRKIEITQELKEEKIIPVSDDSGPSIDAGMPGNEDGAWGSSSYDGWLVD